MKDKIDPKILSQYQKGQEYFDYNELDRDLPTIRVYFKETPPFEEIDGYGLEPKEQYFKPTPIPQKIKELQNRRDSVGNYLTQDEQWQIISDEQDYYKKEIEWIKLQWKRRLYGYWFFNNGQATYIDGWQYTYLNFWSLDVGLPEYRDRDRLFFNFARFCYEDDNCYGFVFPKPRREGSTSKCGLINYLIISLSVEKTSAIQSRTDDDAKMVFIKHIVNPWKNDRLPFFFKPNTNLDDPRTEMSFRPPASKGLKGQRKKTKKGLLSTIMFEASGEGALDGQKITFYHSDECGKTVNVDISNRWDIVKPTMAQGAGGDIGGFSIHTSTAGEMGKGGTIFKKFCEDSNYAEKNSNGQTVTGLYCIFIGAEHGLENYIDKYGMSIIETPTPEQREYLYSRKKANGKPKCPNPEIGAREYLQNQMDFLRKKKDYKKLNEFTRQHPSSFRTCFIADAAQSFFDLVKINDRLDQLHDMPNATTTGYFEWDGKPHNGKVKFVPDPDNPKFELSKVLSDIEANRVKWNQNLESWEALNGHKYCGGGDPFAANQTKAKKNSLGGGAVFEGQDIFKDPDDKPYEEWNSCKFVCTYLWRPADKEEYSEDMIMMCVYFGCPMNPETNVKDLRERFIEKGYRWMLVHHWNIERETQEDIAGQSTSPKIKQAIFKAIQLYVNRHIHKERHKKLIEQIRDTIEIDDMTDNDLFTAAGYAILGFDQYGIEMQEDMKGGDSASQDLTDFIPEYSY